jgi:hypothetical protein
MMDGTGGDGVEVKRISQLMAPVTQEVYPEPLGQGDHFRPT